MSRAKGFTIIELMLSMSFIGVLLVAIALTTIQISNIYNKGLTLREVNQAGRTLSDDLQRSIGASPPFDVDPASDTTKYIVRDGGGRLCVGRYTYAWNYGSALRGGTGAPAVVNTYDDGQAVGFAKVDDPSASLCTDPTAAIPRASANELLSGGDRDLAVHIFTVSSSTQDLETGQALYAISMTIGTNDSSLLTTNDTSCKPPAQASGGEDYCSVNQFDIIARAGNNTEGE